MSGRVIAGIDGSEQSIVALRWAKDEAERREVPLVVVHAWALPVIAGVSVSAGNWREIEKSLEEDARGVLDEAIEHVGAGPTVEAVLIRGSAAETLIKSAHPDDLLVVGSRGLGGFKGLLLGSVSTHCVQHASCPVVVVPTP